MTESLAVPAGTLVIVRMASTLSSKSARVGDRFQAFLDHDLAVSGRLVAAQGSRVFGQVVSVDQGDKMKGQPALGVTLTDVEIGGHVVAITTQPLVAKGEKGTGAKKMLGGAALGAGIGAIADGGQGAAIGAGVGLAAGGVATAASSPGGGQHRRPVGPVLHRVRAVRGADGDAGGRQLSGQTCAARAKEA